MTDQLRFHARITRNGSRLVTETEARETIHVQRVIHSTLKRRGGTAQITDRRDGSVREFTHDGTTLTPVQS